jgi:hypothetical protein
MPKAKASSSELTVKEVIAFLKANDSARKQVVKTLARDHPKEYLALVKINPTNLRSVADRFISSDKEWQE